MSLNTGPVTYFRRNIFDIPLIYAGQLSVTDESMNQQFWRETHSFKIGFKLIKGLCHKGQVNFYKNVFKIRTVFPWAGPVVCGSRCEKICLRDLLPCTTETEAAQLQRLVRMLNFRMQHVKVLYFPKI